MTMSYYPVRVNRFGDAALHGPQLQPMCKHVGVKVWQPYNNVCKVKEKSKIQWQDLTDYQRALVTSPIIDFCRLLGSEEKEAIADCETLPLWTPSTTSTVVGDFRVLKVNQCSSQ